MADPLIREVPNSRVQQLAAQGRYTHVLYRHPSPDHSAALSYFQSTYGLGSTLDSTASIQLVRSQVAPDQSERQGGTVLQATYFQYNYAGDPDSPTDIDDFVIFQEDWEETSKRQLRSGAYGIIDSVLYGDGDTVAVKRFCLSSADLTTHGSGLAPGQSATTTSGVSVKVKRRRIDYAPPLAPNNVMVTVEYRSLDQGEFWKANTDRALLMVKLSASPKYPTEATYDDAGTPTTVKITDLRLAAKANTADTAEDPTERWVIVSGNDYVFEKKCEVVIRTAVEGASMETWQNLAGTTNDADHPNCGGADANTLLFLGVEFVMPLSAANSVDDAVYVADLHFLYDPDGWEAGSTIQKQVLAMEPAKKWNSTTSTYDDDNDNKVPVWRPDEGETNKTATLHPSESDFSALMAKLEWS